MIPFTSGPTSECNFTRGTYNKWVEQSAFRHEYPERTSQRETHCRAQQPPRLGDVKDIRVKLQGVPPELVQEGQPRTRGRLRRPGGSKPCCITRVQLERMDTLAGDAGVSYAR